MTAVFTPAAGSPITLAGSDASGCFDQPTGIRINGKSVIQEEDIVRATVPARFQRNNRRRTCQFTVEKSYDTWDLAVAGNAALEIALDAALGTFVLKNAAAATIFTINNANVDVDLEDGGAFARRHFTVSGTA